MLLALVLLVGGLALIVWAAERFTDGAIGTAALLAISPFYIGIIVSGFEPENLVTGLAASTRDLPQVALGTVVGSVIFLLTAGLGLTLLVVPMTVEIPKAGSAAMVISLLPFALALLNDGTVSRLEGVLLIVVAVGLMTWLYQASPGFLGSAAADEWEPVSRLRALALVTVGLVGMLVGAELLVRGVGMLVSTFKLSETFIGMTLIGMGESLEEAGRMISPARRGHPEIAWGNVVGTVVILLCFNLGIIALVRPLVVDPLVLRLHLPYLVGCTLLIACTLLCARRLGQRMGLLLIGLYILYLGLNLPYVSR